MLLAGLDGPAIISPACSAAAPFLSFPLRIVLFPHQPFSHLSSFSHNSIVPLSFQNRTYSASQHREIFARSVVPVPLRCPHPFAPLEKVPLETMASYEFQQAGQNGYATYEKAVNSAFTKYVIDREGVITDVPLIL